MKIINGEFFSKLKHSFIFIISVSLRDQEKENGGKNRRFEQKNGRINEYKRLKVN